MKTALLEKTEREEKKRKEKQPDVTNTAGRNKQIHSIASLYGEVKPATKTFILAFTRSAAFHSNK